MTHTDRVTPSGHEPYDEGWSSKVAFAADSDLTFWEQIVGAPGFEGGDPIPMTTMFNTSFRTKMPRHLKEMTPFQVQGQFCGGTIDEVNALINVNGWITVTWPDGTQFSFVGFMKSWQPGPAQEGNPLIGTMEVVPTCLLAGVETDYDLHDMGSD